MNTSIEIQQQYEGWRTTPLLWQGDSFGLTQLTIQSQSPTRFNGDVTPMLRLGMRVEQFVFHELESMSEWTVLAKNVQINRNKITLGELDCILKKDEEIIHLEIVYKFYLYDPSVGQTERDHWIGPNRKDSLAEKTTKLSDKQLPLLYSDETQTTIREIGITTSRIQQRVHFKAQLFVPLNMKNSKFNDINSNCIAGVYIHSEDLHMFEDCKFFIPQKANWLTIPHTNVPWLNPSSFKGHIESLHKEKRAPLCWLKQPNGELEKLFVVWW